MKITAIILTYNEELHIARCVNSLVEQVDEIIVIDSYSDDRTIEIVEKLGIKTYQNPFVNQAVQFNWALANCKIKSDWIIRIDADEYFANKKNIHLKNHLSALPSDVNGLMIARKIVFLGRPLEHGGWYPKYNLRMFKNGYGECENKWMDEHIVIREGKTAKLEVDFVDENLNNLKWWTDKHNYYSDRESIDYFLNKNNGVNPVFFGNEAERKRWLKVKYNAMPLFVRPFLNFIYRYVFKFGFLDGTQGFVWHILQGFWYRFLVDVKIYELKKKFKGNDLEIIKHIQKNHKI